jgi:hypothetical protein
MSALPHRSHTPTLASATERRVCSPFLSMMCMKQHTDNTAGLDSPGLVAALVCPACIMGNDALRGAD